LKLVALISISALSALGSTIYTASPATVTGSSYIVTVSANDTQGGDMAGMIVTANFTSGDSLVCTWQSTGTCSSGPGGFSVGYPQNTSTHPINGGTNWTISNNRTGFIMSSITFNGIAGLIAFDRCMAFSGGGFSDNNPLSCLFGAEGTPGSNTGFSVASGTGGTSGIEGTVQYQNAVHLAASSSVGDLWGQITIAFSGATFDSGETFTFRADTDELGQVTANPEPATMGLMGAALALIGFKLRKRK
jgi:hypothetical protein